MDPAGLFVPGLRSFHSTPKQREERGINDVVWSSPETSISLSRANRSLAA